MGVQYKVRFERELLEKTSLRRPRSSAAFADAAPIKDSFRACPLIESSSSQSRNYSAETYTDFGTTPSGSTHCNRTTYIRIAGCRLWGFEKAGIGVSTVSYNPDFSQDLIFSKICYPKPGKKQTDQLYVPLLILERQWWLQAPGQLPDDQPLDQSVPKIQQWSRDSGHAHHQSVGQSGLIQEFFAGSSNQKIRSPSVLHKHQFTPY